jgi:hypothetical protein
VRRDQKRALTTAKKTKPGGLQTVMETPSAQHPCAGFFQRSFFVTMMMMVHTWSARLRCVFYSLTYTVRLVTAIIWCVGRMYPAEWLEEPGEWILFVQVRAQWRRLEHTHQENNGAQGGRRDQAEINASAETRSLGCDNVEDMGRAVLPC